MNHKELRHLFSRAGFGIKPEELHKLSELSKTEVVALLFKESKSQTDLKIDLSEFESVNLKSLKEDKALAIKLRQDSRKKLKPFNIAWVNRLNNPKERLRERLTLFWANHFVCRDNNILHVQKYNNTLRTHALGDFRAFTKAISKEAAMIKYLNIKQNKKAKPNENFARELMELFTLGIGNYTEADIKASARAFTGYNFNYWGDFKHSEKHHDFEDKVFFGASGNFDGDDIIDLILNQKECAQFICTKVYKYFVNYNVNDAHINEMVEVFFPDYNIETLMHFVFTSNWFYNEEHIGTKIKSPIDWLTSINQIIPISFKKPKQLLNIQKMLGQILLFPPNVAGWEEHQSWIDSNTIVLRLKLPVLLLQQTVIPSTYNSTFSDLKQSYFKTVPDWEEFKANYSRIENSKLQDYILNCKLSPELQTLLKSQESLNSKDFVIQLISTPEFQMC